MTPRCPQCGDEVKQQLANSLACKYCYYAAIYGVTREGLIELEKRTREEWARL